MALFNEAAISGLNATVDPKDFAAKFSEISGAMTFAAADVQHRTHLERRGNPRPKLRIPCRGVPVRELLAGSCVATHHPFMMFWFHSLVSRTSFSDSLWHVTPMSE